MTMASSFRAFFALDTDLAIVAGEARERAVGDNKSVASRAHTVRIVRVDRMPTEPPLWLQCRPHWAIVIDDTLYHLLAHPCDDTEGDISTAVCTVAWVSWFSRDAVQGISHVVGDTDLNHNDILGVLSHVVTAFGANLSLLFFKMSAVDPPGTTFSLSLLSSLCLIPQVTSFTYSSTRRC